MTFPKDFYWGAATASYQVEGGIENNDWASAAREARVPAAGKACDHYSRYEEDFELARSLSHNAHRISLEWSRIEPEEGKFDEREIEHYRAVIRAMKARGLEPFITIWHFTIPEWFKVRGGFEAQDAPMVFARYCVAVASALGREARFWMTMNEPLVFAGQGYHRGVWPPFKKSFWLFLSIRRTLARAHRLAYREIKRIAPGMEVGIAKHNIAFDSDGMPWNNFAGFLMSWFWNRQFLNAIADCQDFIGLNHYGYRMFGKQRRLPKTDMGWNIYPPAIYSCLKELSRYKKPIYVTENGIADAKDTKRGEYIAKYVGEVGRAIRSGVDVRGYFYWSLLDNFEWAEGFSKRFGLIEIDYETFERKVRPSALVYKKIIEEGV